MHGVGEDYTVKSQDIMREIMMAKGFSQQYLADKAGFSDNRGSVNSFRSMYH